MNDQLAFYDGEHPIRRRRDVLFDAVMDCYHLEADELTKTERGRINAKLAELRKIGADPDEIARRRLHYQLRFPRAADTFAALVSHWGECATAPNGGPGHTLGAVARLDREEP
jgi:hypothetical protein